MEHDFFGLKNKFGIEIEILNKEKKKGKARFWIEGKQFGEFKVIHRLEYLISGLKELLKNENNLWDERFENWSSQQIATYCWRLDKRDEELTLEAHEEFEKLLKFGPFFGDQFDSASHIILKNDEKFRFIWSTNNDYSGRKIDYLENLQTACVNADVLKEVVQRFFNWYEANFV